MQTKKFHVAKGDTIMVICGKEKNKTGKILQVLPKKNSVIVEGINMVKRHARARGNELGGITEKESAINSSNVLLFCEKCSKPVRTKTKILEKGEKQRICAKCEGSI